MDSAGKNDWLVSQSLERSLDIISAINRMSIHCKLRLAGMDDTSAAEEIDQARDSLTDFVGTLNQLIARAEESEDKIAFGADPRLSTLARRFLSRPAQGGAAFLYDPEDLKALKELLEKRDEGESQALIDQLSRLRSVLEQHAQADAAVIFNEV